MTSLSKTYAQFPPYDGRDLASSASKLIDLTREVIATHVPRWENMIPCDGTNPSWKDIEKANNCIKDGLPNPLESIGLTRAIEFRYDSVLYRIEEIKRYL